MSDYGASDALMQRIAQISAHFGLPDECRRSLFDAVLSLAPGEATTPDALVGSRLEDATPGVEDVPFQVETAPRPARGPLGTGEATSPSEAPQYPVFVLRSERDSLTRYQDLGPIGAGGMGEVRRVRDRTLNRVMAMKIVRPELQERPAALARFIEEAQATAQLQHPGIVPVHELGRLQDGRVYFTMKEVQGVTLRSVIHDLHAASPADRWEAAPAIGSGSPWTFRRLIDAFHKVCEAMAYAHSRGVVHRDLKPSNIMVGSFGEVLVLDWGLAKIRPRTAAAEAADDLAGTEAIVTERMQNDLLATRVGTVTGTPAYMPPEQARGEIERLGPASDVYSLGAILYEILSGRPPYVGPDSGAVLVQVLLGPPLPPGRTSGSSSSGMTVSGELPGEGIFASSSAPLTPTAGPSLPEELVQICLRAMAREAGERYPDAQALATEIGAWLDGAQRRERALKVVEEAEALLPEVERLRVRASSLRDLAQQALAPVKPHEPVERKKPGWDLEDEGRRLERDADLKETEFLQRLQGALTHVPDLPKAHDDLAAFYWRQHVAAEAARDGRAAARLEVLLRAHDRGQYAAYLKGDGALTLVTDPPGAEVELYRYVENERRLIPERVKHLGRTPLRAVSLPMGSYLLKIRALGRAEVRYPVHIGRQEHWDCVRPGERSSKPVYLPRTDELGPDDLYVPAGWFWSGGDMQAFESLPHRRLWMDSFVMRRFPVTNLEFLEFLNALVARRQTREALTLCPRERSARKGRPGALLYGRDEAGRFALKPDAEGDFWLPDWPVVMIDWHGASRYVRWEAERTGLPWRLPCELEWEKAARGVDGRYFPWGDFPDPTWACMHDSFPDGKRPMPAVVDSYPVDESPYGVRGMAGNVRDWCLDVYRREGPTIEDGRVIIEAGEDAEPTTRRIVRGGCWFWHHSRIRLMLHQGVEPWHRDSIFSFRLVRPMP